MLGAIDGLADFGDAAGNSGGSLVVDHHHGFDGMAFVCAEPRLHIGGGNAATAVAGHILHLQAVALGNVAPEVGKMSGLEHQHAVIRRKRVHNRCFPRARTRSWIHHHRAFGLEDRTQPFQHFAPQLGELRAAMVDHRAVHGPQDLVRDVGGPGNLEKMTACVDHGLRSGRHNKPIASGCTIPANWKSKRRSWLSGSPPSACLAVARRGDLA